MTCFANNEGVERLLRDILYELRQMNSKLPPPPLPDPILTPLPPPAAKADVAELPERFLAVSKTAIKTCTRSRPNSWEVVNLSSYAVTSGWSDQDAQALFDGAIQLWIPHKK